LIAYESAVLSALKEVENALVAVQRTAERGEILSRAVTAARTAAELAEKQYTAGQANLLTVLDAQRSYLSLRQQAVSNTANQTKAGIQLYNALGGGWSV
jgi:outer membrane protein TolC